MFGTPALHKALEVCPMQLLRSKSQRVIPDAYLLMAFVLILLSSTDQVPFSPRYVSHFKFAFLIEFFQVSDKLFDFPTGSSNGGPTDTNEFPFSSVMELCPHQSFLLVFAELTLIFWPPPLKNEMASDKFAKAPKPYPKFSYHLLPFLPR